MNLMEFNDAHEYLETRRAMDIVGISEEEQVGLLRSFVCIYIVFLTDF